jgi:TIR domain
MSTADANRPGSIFLNYRREDSKDVTTRLHDDLEHALGAGKVFIDLSSIVPGQPWPQLIRDRLHTASVVLVVIGRDWLKVCDPASFQRRLDADNDWVRVEIEEALRANKIVIPVLVRDAAPPIESQLPPSIRDLVKQQAITISSDEWKHGVRRLLVALAAHGVPTLENPGERPVRPEPSMLGVIDYFYRQMGLATSGEPTGNGSAGQPVKCSGITDLWEFIEDFLMQKRRALDQAPPVLVHGQLSPYAPLLFGNPMHKRHLHLELRQGAIQLIEEIGYEFGELLNGLLSYSAGQMVIRPWFHRNYVYAGLYESIVRNSIPVMIERQYYHSTVGPLFRKVNCLQVRLQGHLGEIPNYTQDALNDFGITDRLRSILDPETLEQVGHPNYALFVHGGPSSFIDFPDGSSDHPLSSRYLDGDVWVANSANSVISRFIDISSREDMLKAVTQITSELRKSGFGRGTVASFDVRLAAIDDIVPDRVLSADQLRQEP